MLYLIFSKLKKPLKSRYVHIPQAANSLTAVCGGLQAVPSKNGCKAYSAHANIMMANVDGFRIRLAVHEKRNAAKLPNVTCR